MKVIGLTGAAGAGKDTAAGYALEWCEENKLKAERVALADPLKKSVGALFGVAAEDAVEWCNGLKADHAFVGMAGHPSGQPAHLTGRQFLQRYGTEAHRDVFGADFWTNVTKGIISAKEREGVKVIFITDVRFDDEADFVHDSNDDWHGEVWRIHRDETELSAAEQGHSSESGILADSVDMLITNDGSLDDLRDGVRLSCEHDIDTEAE